MKARYTFLAAALVTMAFNGAYATDNSSNKKTKAKSQTAATQAAPVDYAKKIAETQAAIDLLKVDIEKIRTERSALQVKLEQSDKEIAAQTLKVEEIKKKLTEKKKIAEAMAKEKKR